MLGAWCPTKTLDVSKDKVSAQNLGFRTSLDLDAVRVSK